MAQVKVWRVLYTSIARVRAENAAEAIDRAHRVAGAALKRAHAVTPVLANDVDIENIDMVSAYFCGTDEVPRHSSRVNYARFECAQSRRARTPQATIEGPR